MKKILMTVPLVALLTSVLVTPLPAQAEEKPVLVVSRVAMRQDRTLLLDAFRADQRAVAVGARGTVFVSADGGKDWKSQRTASTRTLTAVTALNDKTWLAVGHGGTILRSEDGGQTWETNWIMEFTRA